MTRTDELIKWLRATANGASSSDRTISLDVVAAELIALRQAADAMAEALGNYEGVVREHIATEFWHSAWLPENLKEAIDQGRAAIAAYEAAK